ncbi:MAG: SPASM domain-containing protein [Acidobacteria bacterium]|nr:SPASM domain-containing protein [Acidobacteriota bacterium]
MTDWRGLTPACPVEAHIQLATDCAFDCPHCPFFFYPGSALGTADWRRVFDVLVSNDIRHALLLAPDCARIAELPGIVAEATERQLDIELFTGGPMPPLAMWQCLRAAGLDTVIFEIFGPSPFHDRHSWAGSFEQAAAAIIAARHADLRVIAAIRLLPGIEGEFAALAAALPPECQGVVLQHFVAFKCGQEIFAMADETSMKLHGFAAAALAPRPVHYSSCARALDTAESKLCSAGRFKLSVLADGTALPCEHFKRSPMTDLGNILVNSINEIWSAPFIEALRNSVATGGVCGECEDRDHCSQCRAPGFNQNGELAGILPVCNSQSIRRSHA